jgi:threonine synthase
MNCQRDYELGDAYLCEACDGILEVKHDYRENREAMIAEIRTPPSGNIWKYGSLLPVLNQDSFVSLYEGGTPLIRCHNLSARIGFENLYVKDESRNPSGAFKDRPIAVGISKAKELKRDVVTTASSGNAAGSLATYAAKAQTKCYIFVPEHTPSEKVTQALVNGGRVVKVKGDYSNAYATARAATSKFHWVNITTTFLNPYAIEGDKTIAYELFQQLGGAIPDWVLVPTGAGPLVFGVYKGFLELKTLGLVEKTPRMVAVQAEGCAPIVRAFESGGDTVEAWKSPKTVASAIADPLKGYEQDGEVILGVVRESKGHAVSVSDTEILESVFELAENEGIYAEPAAATPVAALKKLLGSGVVNPSDVVVCLVTGHGLKDPKSVMKTIDVPVIEPNLEALARVMEDIEK